MRLVVEDIAATARERSRRLLLDRAPSPAPISPFADKCRGGDEDKRGKRSRLFLVGIRAEDGEHGEAGEQR